MAISLTTGDIVLARIEVSLGVQTALNDLFYEVTTTGGSGVSDVQAALAIDNEFQELYKETLPTVAEYVGVRFNRVYPSPTASFLSETNSGDGTVTSIPLPTQCAAVLTKNTLTPGRAGRGRIYFPFPYVSAVEGLGTMTNAYKIAVGLVATLMSAVLAVGTGGNTAALNPVVYNRVTHGFKTITVGLPSGKWGTQRRRGDYGRPNAP